MITHDQLIFVITKQYPDMMHGRDFLVAHPLGDDGNQCGDPYLIRWPDDMAPLDVPATIARYPEFENEYEAKEARIQRDYLLRKSDWTQGADAPATLSDTWKGYRQALRDVPQQAGFPLDIDWPEPPQ